MHHELVDIPDNCRIFLECDEEQHARSGSTGTKSCKIPDSSRARRIYANPAFDEDDILLFIRINPDSYRKETRFHTEGKPLKMRVDALLEWLISLPELDPGYHLAYFFYDVDGGKLVEAQQPYFDKESKSHLIHFHT